MPEHQRLAISSKEDPTTRSPATRKRFEFGANHDEQELKKSGFVGTDGSDQKAVKSSKSLKSLSEKEDVVAENNHSSSTSSTASGHHLFEEFLVVGVEKEDLIAFDETNPGQG